MSGGSTFGGYFLSETVQAVDITSYEVRDESLSATAMFRVRCSPQLRKAASRLESLHLRLS